jgi:hypothetical protein
MMLAAKAATQNSKKVHDGRKPGRESEPWRHIRIGERTREHEWC